MPAGTESNSSTAGDTPGRARTGFLLMLVATTALGLFPSGARIAYQGGASPEAVAVLRHFLTFAFLLLLQRSANRERWWRAAIPSRHRRYASLVLGVILAVFAWSYIASVRYIPVSLAVLLLYTFPAQVVLMTSLAGLERPSPAGLTAITVAFGGVALAVGVQSAPPQPVGIALGLLAGFGLALITVLGSRLTRTPDGRALAAQMAFIATLLTAVAGFLGSSLALPGNPSAWAGFVFAGTASALGTALYFVALPMIGPIQASALSNLEPVIAVLGALLILGEPADAGRIAGIVMVVGAIAVLQWSDRRRAARVRAKGPVPLDR